MIRLTAIGSLLALLALVLYIPSVFTAERFIAQLRAEYAAAAAYWGDAPASRSLDVAIALTDSARVASPPASADHPAPAAAVDAAVGREMNSVNARLFGNAYFRSIDALLVLATFRVSMLMQVLPWFAAFAIAVSIDGYLQRTVKSREFRQHDPEVFALAACATIALLCGSVVATVTPFTLHPLALPVAALLACVFIGRALASYHHRP